MTHHDPQLIERLAETFVSILRKTLPEDVFAEVQRRNGTAEYYDARDEAGQKVRACASLDFCDADHAMAMAFQVIVGREPDFLHGVKAGAELAETWDLELANKAWDRALVKDLGGPPDCGVCKGTGRLEIGPDDLTMPPVAVGDCGVCGGSGKKVTP